MAFSRSPPRSLAWPGDRVAGTLERGGLKHQYVAVLVAHRTVLDSLWDDSHLTFTQHDVRKRPLHMDRDSPSDHVEKFIFVLVIVPVELALKQRHSYDLIVDPCEVKLISPRPSAPVVIVVRASGIDASRSTRGKINLNPGIASGGRSQAKLSRASCERSSGSRLWRHNMQ